MGLLFCLDVEDSNLPDHDLIADGTISFLKGATRILTAIAVVIGLNNLGAEALFMVSKNRTRYWLLVTNITRLNI